MVKPVEKGKTFVGKSDGRKHMYVEKGDGKKHMYVGKGDGEKQIICRKCLCRKNICRKTHGTPQTLKLQVLQICNQLLVK